NNKRKHIQYKESKNIEHNFTRNGFGIVANRQNGIWMQSPFEFQKSVLYQNQMSHDLHPACRTACRTTKKHDPKEEYGQKWRPQSIICRYKTCSGYHRQHLEQCMSKRGFGGPPNLWMINS